MSKSPITPKGTRDFSPSEMIRREYLFNTIKKVFQRHGFLPIETPAMENLATLTGKYGEEGDRLIFKILNSGDYLKDVQSLPAGQAGSKFDVKSSKDLTPYISEKALRYDLTVPFARYVVQHQNDITFPFKRYQIQPVWRADRPQKGRYREFYQCDVDVIGSDSLLNEVELIQIIDEVFSNLNLPVDIRINNRKILIGLAEVIGIRDKFNEIVVALDKWDKVGREGVEKELTEKGINTDEIQKIAKYAQSADIEYLETDFNNTEGEKGVEELKTILDYIESLKIENVKFDPTLTRGLDYYTGTIIEVTTKDFPGSICAGGRYDDLTSIFGLPGISGVGISFGADRIYDILNERNLFPDLTGATTQLMFVNFGEKEERYCMKLLAEIRKAGINAEIYPSAAKMKKQMSYANAKSIPYVVLVGSEEMQSGKLTLKNMDSGEQEKLTVADNIEHYFPRLKIQDILPELPGSIATRVVGVRLI